AGIGVFWGKGDKRNLSERLPGEQTNNRAEIYAVIRAIETCENKDKHLEIMADSKYVKNAMECWIKNWEKNGYTTCNKTQVKNIDFFKRLKKIVDDRVGTVIFTHVRGHSGNYGNEQADWLSKEGAIKEAIVNVELDSRDGRMEKTIRDSVSMGVCYDDLRRGWDRAVSSTPSSIASTTRESYINVQTDIETNI
ncbi:26259_t:CDS:2, partial [Racocetra persica]